MVYQDIVDWIRSKSFDSYNEAYSYITSHQGGKIFPSQQDALDFYFGAQQPEEIAKPETPLEQLQEELIKKSEIPQEFAPEANIPSIKEEQQQKENVFRRLVKRLFGR